MNDTSRFAGAPAQARGGFGLSAWAIRNPIPVAVVVIGLKTVQAVVTQGVSTTSLQFEIGENLQKKIDDVRSKIAQARAILPRDIDEPIVQQVEMDEAAPILTYAVTAPGMSDDALSWFIDDTISRTLQGAK